MLPSQVPLELWVAGGGCPFSLHEPVCSQPAPACDGLLASMHHPVHVKYQFVGRAGEAGEGPGRKECRGRVGRRVSKARGDESGAEVRGP